jgi:hypothetical protein
MIFIGSISGDSRITDSPGFLVSTSMINSP